ncbi:MAG TPA: hypothetical protein PLL92_14895 [Alicycliphilus sp.]|nr:hypothetical protein [Alicycliphilus sp.]
MKNTRNLIAVAALAAAAFAGAASAATQSPESWVGAEPVTAGPALTRAEVQADLNQWNRAVASAPMQSPEAWVGAKPVAQGPALSRAEVQADLALWNRVGLGQYGQGERSIVDTPNYEAKLAEYRRLRGETHAVAGQASAVTAY